MRKRALGITIALILLLQCISISTVNAAEKSISGTSKVYSRDVVKEGWGTLGISDVKFNMNTPNSTSASLSAFNKLLFYRDQDKYTGASEDTEFFCMGNNNYPKIKINNAGYTNFYGVHNPKNNKKDFDVDFAAYLDDDLKALAKKGDLQIMIMADTANTSKRGDFDTGIASIRFYGSGTSILKQISTPTTEIHDYRYSTNSGWGTFPHDCTRITAYLESRGGQQKGKDNWAMVYNVRVYLKDAGVPKVTSVELVDTGWRSYKTYGSGKAKNGKGKVIGDTVRYKVIFDEKVNVTGTPQLQLDAGNNFTGLKANYVAGSGTNTLYFDYVIEDRTNYTDTSEIINTLGLAKRIIFPSGASITDIAGNKYNQNTLPFTNTTFTIDDTTTLIHKANYQDTQNGKFYPKKTLYYENSTNNGYLYAVGNRPKELNPLDYTEGSGDEENQPIMFGIIDGKGPVFRIVLNEEIQLGSLSTERTKLKLQIHDKDKNPIEDKYVNADLVGARFIGVSDKNYGINTGQTELLFRYMPNKTDFGGLSGEVFYLNFKGKYIENKFVFDDDTISPTLKNVSGMDVLNSKLVLPSTVSKGVPFDKMVGIDVEAPVLIKNNIDNEYKKELGNDSYLEFKDEGSGLPKGAAISICYYEGTDKKMANISYPGVHAGTSLLLPCINGIVNLKGLSVAGNIPNNGKTNYPLYLEYELRDKAGNIAENKGLKNIELKIDTTAPTIDGVNITVDKNKAKAAYGVSDRGVGEILPEFYYKVETGVSSQVPIDKPLSGASDNQEVDITGAQGSKNTYQVWASFSDTLGNWMEGYYPSGPIDIATREFSLSLYDSAEGRVAKEHNIKIRGDKIPDKDFIIRLYYKWVPSGKPEPKTYRMAEYKPQDFVKGLTSFNLSSKEIQKLWMNPSTNGISPSGEALFSGEATFKGYAQMWTTTSQGELILEATQENIIDTFYFDIAPPVIDVDVTGEHDGYNSDYLVQFRISDDGGEYHGGIYVPDGNIDLKSNPPAYEIILGDKSLGVEPFNYSSGSFTIPFGSRFKNEKEYKDVTQAFIRFSATDRFGNKTSEIYGMGKNEDGSLIPIKVDFQPPEITELIPVYKRGMVEGRDYVKFSEGDNLYIVRNLPDVLDAVKIIQTDNVEDEIFAKYYQGVNLVKARYPGKSTSHTFTIDKLTYQSFDISSFRDMLSYVYRVDVMDMAGNLSSSGIRFIEDDNPPVITYINRSEGEGLTSASSIDIGVTYSYDGYETLDDMKFEIEGNNVEINTEKSRIGKLVLTAVDNGDIKIKITDRLGNFAEKAININCFDKTPPETTLLSDTGYPQSPSKCGEMVFEVSDDRELGSFSIAITKDVPSEDDYFYNELPNNLDYPNGYFGMESEYAYASLGQLHYNLSAADKDVRRYRLSYYALPSGEYDVYTKNIDAAGNVKVDKIGNIISSSEPVSVTDMVYSPLSATGGSVRVEIKTDSPSYIKELAYLSGDSRSSGNVGIMQTSVEKARAEGYSYIWEGRLTELKTFGEIYGKYLSIVDNESPTNEDKYLYKYVYPDPNEYRNFYEDFLYDAALVEPVGDMVDFMMNKALYSSSYSLDYWNQLDAPVINMSGNTDDPSVNMLDDIVAPLMESGILMWWSDEWSDPIPGLKDATDLRLYFGRNESPAIDVLAYPQPFDTYVVQEEIFEKGDEGNYINLDLFFEKDGNGVNYKNPFIDNGEPLSGEQIIKALLAIKLLQPLRAKTINTVADKYVKAYAKISDMGISMNHLLTFDYNIDKDYTLVDLSGQERVFNIKVDNINPSIPHIPKEQIWLEDSSGNKVLSYTNAESIKLVIDNENPIHDIYREYYIFDVQGGQVTGTTDTDKTYDNKPLYKKVEVTVTDNTEVTFKIINPTVLSIKENIETEEQIVLEDINEQEPLNEGETETEEPIATDDLRELEPLNEGKTAIGEQSYGITQFDRTAPSASLEYSPARILGNFVNTDVTVTLTDIMDDKSTLTGVTVDKTQYTFVENGSVDFIITDEAGNRQVLTATVDYIDKTPVNLTAEFFTQSGQPITAFTRDYNDSNPQHTLSTYEYTGDYSKNPIQAVIYDKGTEVSQFTIDTATRDTSYEYVGSSGNMGTLIISDMKFDTLPPTASDVIYTFTKAGKDVNESYITAKFTLSDNVITEFSKNKHLISVNGADEKSNAFTKADVIFSGNEVSLKFNYNGSARLVFSDDAKNLLTVDLQVENLDKMPPTAYIEYSKTEITNKDVTAAIYLSEPADYMVMDGDNNVIKDYSGSYTSYPINYVFTENKTLYFVFRDVDGNLSKTYVVTITNIDKTPPELDYEILYKKALTTSEEPTLIDFAGAATIKLFVKDISIGDQFTGNKEQGDTIFITNRANSIYHTVIDNGSYSFMYSDNAGNVKTILVSVTGIDKTMPTAKVTGNPTAWTNTPADITITPRDNAGNAYVVLNGKRYESYTFTSKQNSNYKFIIEDESKNSAMVDVKVEYIDITPPNINYTGYQDLFVKAGEFDENVRQSFEDVTLSDMESGLVSDKPVIKYPKDFNPNKPGEYNVTFSATDRAGNKATLVRKIKVLGETDVIIIVNNTEVMPNSQVVFNQGELTLSIVNAEKTGKKIAYAFEPGLFNPAEMKGTAYKKTMSSTGTAVLNANTPGMYTLLIQTEDRQTIVSYLFILGTVQ